MGRYAQLVMGPAGCGKSTYCAKMVAHAETVGRRMHIVNLDPAAEGELGYEPIVDVRTLVRASDVSEQLGYGPNGALMYCVQYLAENTDWLLDELGEDTEDDYLLVDCPGQIELYSHVGVVRTIANTLMTVGGYNVVGLYLVDALFLADPAKFVSGALAALSAMARLEIPHINVLSKMDLLKTALPLARQPRFDRVRGNSGFFSDDPNDFCDSDKYRLDDDSDSAEDSDDGEERTHAEFEGEPLGVAENDLIDRYLDVDIPFILGELDRNTPERFRNLNHAIGGLLEDYSMVSFVPLNIFKQNSLATLLNECDNALQFGEDEEPREPEEEGAEVDDEDGSNVEVSDYTDFLSFANDRHEHQPPSSVDYDENE